MRIKKSKQLSIILIVSLLLALTACSFEKGYEDLWDADEKMAYMEQNLEEKYHEDFKMVNFDRGGVSYENDRFEFLLAKDDSVNPEHIVARAKKTKEGIDFEDNYFNHLMIGPYSRYIEDLFEPYFKTVKYEYKLSLDSCENEATEIVEVTELGSTGFDAHVNMFIPESELEGRKLESIMDEFEAIMVVREDMFIAMTIRVTKDEFFEQAKAEPYGDVVGDEWRNQFVGISGFLRVTYGRVDQNRVKN